MSAWDRRLARAQGLEKEYPAAAELLRFYQEIVRFQGSLGGCGAGAESERALRKLVQRIAPKGRAADWDVSAEGQRFLTLVLQQADSRQVTVSPEGDHGACPECGALPVVAVLRPEGEGGKRSLVCSRCFSEWTFRRLVCPQCGNEEQKELPVYTAEAFPHIRVEACDRCRTYLKSIDMTRNGLAVPEVDELASIPLDLWAGENGYTKIERNLLGL